MFRKIYMVEVFKDAAEADDMIVARRFAANKKTADRIARQYKNLDADIVVRAISKSERSWINTNDVERIK